jgi:cyclic pyranopterin phosphate synthase
MVDVSDKAITVRHAIAEGWIEMKEETLRKIVKGGPKGDAIRVAELAGIQAAKRTWELIPLCHLLPAVSVTVELFADTVNSCIRGSATARVKGTTGVEMEALTAMSVALLTIYDMGKAIDRGMTIGGIHLVEKAGGKTKYWRE